MKIGTMFRDVAASLVKKPMTERYPQVRKPVPSRLRGQLEWHSQTCTGCALCVMDCPAAAIDMIVLDKKARRFVLLYHLDRCTFCGQCVESCRLGCLAMSAVSWELAALDKTEFTLTFGEDKDVKEALARGTASPVGDAASE